MLSQKNEQRQHKCTYIEINVQGTTKSAQEATNLDRCVSNLRSYQKSKSGTRQKQAHIKSLLEMIILVKKVA